MKKTSEVICKVIDNSAMFFELARRLAREYKKVSYYVPNDDSAPMPNPSYVGYGYGDVEISTKYFGKDYDDSDLLVFAGVGMGDWQDEAEAQGKAVWGSRAAEDFELNREWMLAYFEKRGIPVGDCVKDIIGVDALRQYSKHNKDFYVKVSRWRGLMETHRAIDSEHLDRMLDIWAYKLGAIKNLIPFIAQKKIKDKVEIGQDLYTVNGLFPSLLSNGLEIKDKGYVTAIKKYEDTPKCLRDVNDVLAPAFKELGARCTFATEMKVGKDHIAIPIDLTLRSPSPPGELIQELYTNLGDIYSKGANGELIDPIPVAKFGVQINIFSDQLNHKETQTISYPDEFDKNVKLHNAIKEGKYYHCMPLDYEGDEGAGAVVGWGDSIEEAAEMIKEVVDNMEGTSLNIPVESIVKDAEEELEKADKMGLKML